MLCCADGDDDALPAMIGTYPAVTVPLTSTPTSTTAAIATTTSVPALDSDPAARDKLYLDFTGTASATSWGSYHVSATPAYDIDGNPATFSAQEIANIQEIWARVAEKYSPFNIDVTTVAPAALTPGQVLRVVVGGNGSWIGGGAYGGYSYIGSFTTYNNTSWVFSSNMADGDPHYTAEAICHESGHGFGLQHQSSYSGNSKTNEYNPGNSYTAPVMGISYSAVRGLWWDGQSSLGAGVIQDDMAVISRAVGYRPQDHGQTLATADPLSVSGGSLSASGVIEQTTDTDTFSFTTAAGTISLDANIVQYGPTLDLRLSLLDRSGNVLATAGSATQLSESITDALAAGTYYVRVSSYGNYGDVGQYTLRGTVAPPPTLAGDLNHDGTVNFADALILMHNYGSTPQPFQNGDLNGDGTINFADVLLLIQSYGDSAATAPQSAVSLT